MVQWSNDWATWPPWLCTNKNFLMVVPIPQADEIFFTFCHPVSPALKLSILDVFHLAGDSHHRLTPVIISCNVLYSGKVLLVFINCQIHEGSFLISSQGIHTVNVDIFTQLNFHVSSPMTHIRTVTFPRIWCLFLFVLIQFVLIIISTHIKVWHI